MPHNWERFSEYVDSILGLVRPSQPIAPSEWRKKVGVCLDGEPSRILREQVPQAELRQQGTYFTGPRLARRLANAATGLLGPCLYSVPRAS